MANPTARYALFYSPPEDSDLGKFGNEWLSPIDRTAPRWVTDNHLWEEATKSPSHYGFHGTLKAPFRLADGQTEAGLIEAVQDAAQSIATFEAPPVVLKRIGHFLALVFDQPCQKMHDLHRTCLEGFETFRAKLNQEEIEKRLNSNLSEKQLSLLNQFGYPYVLDEFRFHLTLAGRLQEQKIENTREILEEKVAAYSAEPLPVTDICLFFQPDKHTRFNTLRRIALTG